MMENRSFDHYYGTYPGRAGLRRPPGRRPRRLLPGLPATAPASAGRRLLPFHLDTVDTDMADCTFDLTHNWGPQHQCRNGGTMDPFVRVHTDRRNEGPSQGVLTMGYYTRADLPYYYALADAFTLCDGYHCSVMGPTHPNRLMQMSGTLDPAGKAGGPVIVTNGSPSALFSVHWDTMPEVLEDAGVSWKYYNPPGPALQHRDHAARSVSPPTACFRTSPSTEKPSSPLYQKAFLPRPSPTTSPPTCRRERCPR